MRDETAHFRGISLDRQDHYFSVDIETDGPIPSDFSMLSFGIVEAGTHDGIRYSPPESPKEYYVELQPLPGAKYDAEALEINGLDRRELLRSGTPPDEAMGQAASWIRDQAGGRRPVMVGSPAVFDWMFLHWYFVKFSGGSPFGYSSSFDLKTMIAVKTRVPIVQASVKHLPRWLMGTSPRTHNALDDARNQAQAFSNVIEWRGMVDVNLTGGANERI